MDKRVIRRWVLSSAVMLLLVACGGMSGKGSCGASDSVPGEDLADVIAKEADPVISDMTAEAMNLADALLGDMTLEERVGQLFMPSIYASSDDATMGRLRDYISELHVGGVVLLKGDLNSAAVMAAECASAGVPLFVSIDAEWGLGMRLKDAPGFPRNGRITPEADEELLYDYGREVARESRRVGINMVLGPVIDVAENPHGVIGSRSFGSDPVKVADLGVAYAMGLESGGVISVAKHFPGHGSPAEDSHRTLPVISRSLHQLDSIDLYPFRSYVDAGLSGVMVGHLAVPAVDPESLPAAVSSPVINDLLRGELGFKGLVLTDALNMKGVLNYGAADAIAAGADLVVAPADTRREMDEVIRRVGNGEIDSATIDDRCRRVLFHKVLSGLWSESPGKLEGLHEDVVGHSDSLRHRLTR